MPATAPPPRPALPLTQRDKALLGVVGVTAGLAVVTALALVRALRPAGKG